MANNISRARMIISISRRANYTLIDVENCRTMCGRIDWSVLREEDCDLYYRAIDALLEMHLIQ